MYFIGRNGFLTKDMGSVKTDKLSCFAILIVNEYVSKIVLLVFSSN